MNKRGKHGQEHKPATISNFQGGIVLNEKKRRTVIERDDEDWLSDCLFISCVYVWMIFTATNFEISSSIFCDAQVKIFHAGSAETIFLISANCSCLDFWQIPLQIVFEAVFIFSMIYVHWICFQARGSLFFFICSRHQKHTEEALWIQVTGSAFVTENKQASPECAI